MFIRDESFNDVLCKIHVELLRIQSIGDPYQTGLELSKLIYAIGFTIDLTDFIITGIPIDDEK